MVERDRKDNPPLNYKIGEVVTLRIPPKNRTAAQNKRLVCRVLGQDIPGQYNLQTEHGVLSNTYPSGEIDATSGTLEFTIRVSNPEKKISLNFDAKQERTRPQHQHTASSAALDPALLHSAAGEVVSVPDTECDKSIRGTIVVQQAGGWQKDLLPERLQESRQHELALVEVDSDGS